MRRLVLCALVGILACGGGDISPIDAITGGTDGGSGVDPNDGARSGARLKLTWYVFADGTRQWNGWWDAQRKENCYVYENWTDGNAYCVPDNGGSVVFSAADCTTGKLGRIYKDPNCAQPPPAYFLDESNTGCSYRPSHLYTRGAATTVAQYWELNYDGSCGGPYAASTTYDAFYQLGAEIPKSELVKVTIGSPMVTGRLGQRFYQSDDGMRRPAAVHDAMLGTDCYPSIYDTTSNAVCTPSAGYSYYLGDAGCTQPKLDVASACAKPQYMATTDINACPNAGPHFYLTGSQVAAAPLYYGNPASCSLTTPAANTNYYSIGQAVQPGALTYQADAAAGHRLQLEHFKTPEGLSFRDYALLDTAKNAQCSPQAMPDGSVRCVPYGGYTSTYYTNATCTQPIDVVEVSTGPSSCGAPYIPPFASKFITPPPGSCTYTSEIHPVTTPYAGPLYANYGTCQPYTPFQAVVYSIGPALPITDFLPATIDTDP